ncbi:MAG: hypothetical protein IJT44_12525 [Clostridia bacterium]|nr:hypothetical protein [Clostridia bacterium]
MTNQNNQNNPSARRRTADARMRRRMRRIVIAAVTASLLIFTVYEVHTLRKNPVQTTTALEDTVYDYVDTQAFILRDEQSVDADLSGYTVPFVQDGDRVESNAQIAARFADAGSAQRYHNLKDLRAEYDRYAALSSGREYSSMKVRALMQKSADRMCTYLQALDSGNIADAKSYESDFIGQETALDIAVTGDLDLSQKLSELSQKIRAEETTIGEYEAITTGVDSAGYFFSRTDGYEDVLSYADADALTVSQLERALKRKPAKTAGGKIVKTHVWYIAAVVDAQAADTLTDKKGTVRISFPKAGVPDVHASVYALHSEPDGRCAAVFRCIEVSEPLLRLRKTEAHIIMGEKTGFKVPLDAVRILDMDVYDENGNIVRNDDGTPKQAKTRCVFILRGNVVSQRRLNVVYTDENYLLSAPPDPNDGSMSGSYVKRYDEIITGGKNLYAGAVIYE